MQIIIHMCKALSKALCVDLSLTLATVLRARYSSHFHFTHEEVEVQRCNLSNVTQPVVAELKF